jgi:hypothetical protein
MINGLHAIVYHPAADSVRAFLSDTLGFTGVDAGGGWLIFQAPPAELAVHPGEEPQHELYFMCDDLTATMAELAAKGVEFGPVTEQRWGLLTTIKLHGGGELGLYEPHHPRAHG